MSSEVHSWIIVCQACAGLEAAAVSRISAAIYREVGRVIPVYTADTLDGALLATHDVVLIGRPTQRYLAPLIADGVIEAPTHPQGYAIRVCDSCFGEDRQMALIVGGADAGVLYGAVEFVNRYAGEEAYDHKGLEVTDQRFYETTFRRKMPEYRAASAPAFARRGIWTWGHCIYDYRRFFENMVTLKLNEAVIWNDFAPVNAREVVDYAHARGIEVVWGFSWGWGLNCLEPGFRIDDESVIEAWAEKVFNAYTRDYAPSGADGIYFQSFTETKSEQIDGVYISEAVVKWVNRIGGRLLEAYPDLQIQFGLHASSVDRRLFDIAGVDPRIHIVWEDCGAFPYHYSPRAIDGFDETMALNAKVCRLRGEHERFGAVLKGMVKLDWHRFKHQTGPYVMGELDPLYVAERRRQKEKIWKKVQGDWLENAEYARRLIAETCRITKGRANMQMLVEDGCIEDAIFFPLALCSALLWQPEVEITRLIGQTARIPQVHFANL